MMSTSIMDCNWFTTKGEKKRLRTSSIALASIREFQRISSTKSKFKRLIEILTQRHSSPCLIWTIRIHYYLVTGRYTWAATIGRRNSSETWATRATSSASLASRELTMAKTKTGIRLLQWTDWILVKGHPWERKRILSRPVASTIDHSSIGLNPSEQSHRLKVSNNQGAAIELE